MHYCLSPDYPGGKIVCQCVRGVDHSEELFDVPRKFQQINHPEPEADGTFLYSVSEIGWTDPAQGRQKKTYTRVADNLTLEQADAWIAEHGEMDD
jgi:hypothetical protein